MNENEFERGPLGSPRRQGFNADAIARPPAFEELSAEMSLPGNKVTPGQQGNVLPSETAVDDSFDGWLAFEHSAEPEE